LTALVPASVACPNTVVTSPNRVHTVGTPDGSCNPPAQASPYLTVGTPDANGSPANMNGSLRLDVCPVPGCAAPNVLIQMQIADIRCQTGAIPCGLANAAGGADYAGEVEGFLHMRITDRLNGPNLPDAASGEIDFPFTVACTPTDADTTRGSDCNLVTDANAVVAGAFANGKRSVVELEQMIVRDGGSDGDADTKPDNKTFAVQGLLIP
jgi:hypothetical protein